MEEEVNIFLLLTGTLVTPTRSRKLLGVSCKQQQSLSPSLPSFQPPLPLLLAPHSTPCWTQDHKKEAVPRDTAATEAPATQLEGINNQLWHRCKEQLPEAGRHLLQREAQSAWEGPFPLDD